MISIIFSIYDSKAEFYLPLVLFNSKGESLRNFADAVNNPDTMLSKHAADFTLFEVGSFDNTTGEIALLETKINLGNALEFQETQAEMFAAIQNAPHHAEHPNNGK